jgi:serine/threonine-protein kinase HipA
VGAHHNRIWLGDKDKLYLGLPPLLADSLPDHWGNSIFKAWLRDNGIRSSDVTPVDLLSFIGKRTMGALEFEPAYDFGSEEAFDVDVIKLYDFAKEVLAGKSDITLKRDTDLLWHDLVRLGTSPGGRRPKAIVAMNMHTGEIKSGQTDVPEGFVHYILKYDDGLSFPFARMEYVYYKMATLSGIEMMPSMLYESADSAHFLTQRFDRNGNEKIHTQTLAAMCPGADDSDDMFDAMRRLHLPYKDIEQQFLRLAFNVFSRNVDDHSKNFSFCMDRNSVWRLSPAYDLTFSVDTSAPAYVNRHSLFVNGKNQDRTVDDLLEIADRNDVRNPSELIRSVCNAIDDFKLIAADLKVPAEIIDMVWSEIKR